MHEETRLLGFPCFSFKIRSRYFLLLKTLVGVPCKRLLDTVTVKCGHCNHLSFLSPRPIQQPLTLAEHPTSQLQVHCSDCLRVSPPSSSFSSESMIQKPPFVVKPPEKKHRMPSAYNRFMKEEIQRIKAAQPDIPHREAFSMAAKNWAKCDPRCSTTIASTSESKKLSPISEVERSNSFNRTENSKVYDHGEKED
ncbi:protein DROOPING LEAF-like isoform X1 [Zingiber officinale]|uniref:protein DROOPING LEAF-like isoform X1 n=1 Tax=Zingiber officinale TaxID=94328 RepID=UPI001C4B93D1|nr:protein DROOPING LEAF-like isoform X1 [Zingiber officinale]